MDPGVGNKKVNISQICVLAVSSGCFEFPRVAAAVQSLVSDQDGIPIIQYDPSTLRLTRVATAEMPGRGRRGLHELDSRGPAR